MNAPNAIMARKKGLGPWETDVSLLAMAVSTRITLYTLLIIKYQASYTAYASQVFASACT